MALTPTQNIAALANKITVQVQQLDSTNLFALVDLAERSGNELELVSELLRVENSIRDLFAAINAAMLNSNN